MLNVLVATRFDEAHLARLRQISPRLSVTCVDADAADHSRADILYTAMPPRDLSRAPNLKWVQLHLAGVNGLRDHPIYTDSAIPLTTTSGVHAATVAEFAIAMMLALAHRVPRMLEWQGRGAWPSDQLRWPLFVPTEVRGATLGIIGYGSIGRELARIAKSAFAMTVLACKRDVSRREDADYCPPGTGDPEGRLPDEWFPVERMGEMLSRADVAVMCAPLTARTRHMIDAAALRRMRASAYFINVGRGATVDERALAQALADKRIAGAAIDVFAEEPPPAGHPFYALDNVILSPHVSGFIPTYDDRCSVLFAENLRRFLDGAPLLNLVDRVREY